MLHLRKLANSQGWKHPELAQAAGPFPRPVINPMEIQEIGAVLAVEVGKVRVDWFHP